MSKLKVECVGWKPLRRNTLAGFASIRVIDVALHDKGQRERFEDLVARAETMTWQVPTELPDLRRVDIVALDTETNDEGLRADRGSAWPWHGGYVCGISVAWRDESGIRGNYFPLRHPDSENFERENVARWLKDHIAAGVRIVTQNGLYDWGWLCADLGIAMPPSDQLEEIGALATLIDENRFSYGLDSLCAWRGLPGKDTALLEEAVKAAGFKVSKKTPLQSYIWQLPAHLVGPYAEADPIATLALFERPEPNPRSGRHPRRLSARSRSAADGACRCAGAAFASIRVRPNRRATIACRNATRARRAVGAARHPRQHARDRVANMEGAHLRRPRHQLPAHGERQSVIQGRQTRLDGRASALAAAPDRDRQQVRSTPEAHFSKATS